MLPGKNEWVQRRWAKAIVLLLLVAAIISLPYITYRGRTYLHDFFQMLFYLPLILASFWFGLRGALVVCASITALYIPYVVMQWNNLSFQDFNELLEMVLFFCIAVVLGFLREREIKERQARMETESLAAVGKAASEIAHDMKNPLMAIGGFSRQISNKLPSDDPLQGKLGIVIQETCRLESMVREMLEFGKPPVLQITETDPNRLIQECVEVVRHEAEKSGVEIKTALDPSLPSCPLDESRAKQVIINLMSNAIQASFPGSEVWVKTYGHRRSIIIKVVDQGHGIPEDQKYTVFEPFFSTKNGGTGLGLSIAKRIVESHGGEIWFSPNPHRGVTFTVKLPK